jgi:hypothetical protein
MFRTMNDEHEAKLKTLLRLQPAEALPESVVNWYWTYKELADRIGACNLTDEALIYIVMQAVPQDLPSEPAETFLNVLADNPEIHSGATVLLRWQRGQWVESQFIGVNGDKQIVVMYRNEERTVSPDRVKLPEAAPIKAAA